MFTCEFRKIFKNSVFKNMEDFFWKTSYLILCY